MEPEIKLSATEMVQMEGWLMKRKAGYESDELGNDGSETDAMSHLPTQLTPTGSKLEALLLRKTERKRYFVLTTQRGEGEEPPRAILTYCSKKPVFVKNDGHASNLGQLAKKAFQNEVNSQFVRGQIELTDTTDVTLTPETSEIKIVIPGKTYYVRPTQAKGKNAAEVKIEVGQWYTAIRRAIKDVWDMQRSRNSGVAQSLRRSNDTKLEQCPDTLQEVLDSRLHRKNFRLFCEFSHASENLDFYEKVEEYEAKYVAVVGAARSNADRRSSGSIAATLGRLSARRSSRPNVPKDLRVLGRAIVSAHVAEGSAEQVNLSDGSRSYVMDLVSKLGDKAFTPDLFAKAKAEIFQLMETNFFMRFHREEQRKTGCFSQLYGKDGMRGYELVLGHFGKVKTDLDRLLDLYQLRIDQVEAQLRVLRRALHISNDVAIPSLRTTREAAEQIFRSSAVRIQGLTEFKTQLNEHVHFPLTWLKKSIELQLESIINAVQDAVDLVDAAKSGVDEARVRHQELQVLNRQSQQDDFPTEAALETLRRFNVDADKVADAMRQAEAAIPVCEMAHTRIAKELEDKVIDSLDKLESLELHRLESQQRAIKHAVEAEKAFFESLHKEAVVCEAVINKVNPAADLQRFVADFTSKLHVAQDAAGADEV